MVREFLETVSNNWWRFAGDVVFVFVFLPLAFWVLWWVTP